MRWDFSQINFFEQLDCSNCFDLMTRKDFVSFYHNATATYNLLWNVLTTLVFF
jgi:hypothetical protein